MKICYLCLIFLFSCSEQQQGSDLNFISSAQPVKITQDMVIKNDTLFFKGLRFSGKMFDLYPSNDTSFTSFYINGLKHGLSKKWFENAELQEIRTYSNGRKQGHQISYWENGHKRFEFHAENDMYQGELREWSAQGNLIHLAHFKDGQEEGVQQLFYDNGIIRANYVIIKGRRYGLLGTKNCKNVTNNLPIR